MVVNTLKSAARKVGVPLSLDLTSDREVLAGTLYGEIRGGSQAQRENVASVILTRVEDTGKSFREVCLQNKYNLAGELVWQFSCWSTKDVNRALILKAPYKDSKIWSQLLAVADETIKRTVPRRPGDADHYWATVSGTPWWARGKESQITYADGMHTFWREFPRKSGG